MSSTHVLGVTALTLTLSCALTTPAAAQLNLGQRKHAKQVEKRMAYNYLKEFKRHCGHALKLRIDWQSFRGELRKKLDGKLHVSFAGFCGEPIHTMAMLCRDDKDSKVSIAQRIHHYVCRFGGVRRSKKKSTRAISLRGGTLTFFVDWKAANNSTYVTKYLNKKL